MQNVVIPMGNEYMNNIQNYTIGEGLEFSEKQISLFLNIQYEFAKLELQGLFTTNEAWIIVESLNGVQFSPEYSVKFILSGFVEDYIHNGFAEEFYDVDFSLLLKKLNRLTEFQAYTVLNMVREFIDIELDEDSNHESEDLLNEIFMVTNKENVLRDETFSEELNQCEGNNQNTKLNLQIKLAEEKLGHISTILELRYGIDIVIGLNEEEDYSLFIDCDKCRGFHFLESYLIEEAVILDAVTEADYLIEKYVTD